MYWLADITAPQTTASLHNTCCIWYLDKEMMELWWSYCNFSPVLTLRSGGRRMTRVSRTAHVLTVPGPAPALSLQPWHPPGSWTLPAPRRLLAVNIASSEFYEEWGIVLITGPILYQSLSSIIHITAALEILCNLKNISYQFQFCQEVCLDSS